MQFSGLMEEKKKKKNHGESHRSNIISADMNTEATVPVRTNSFDQSNKNNKKERKEEEEQRGGYP
jgi:hypothetical protein